MNDGCATAEPNVFSHGMEDTRETLAEWRDGRWHVLRGWFALSLAIALTLLAADLGHLGLLPHDVTPSICPA